MPQCLRGTTAQLQRGGRPALWWLLAGALGGAPASALAAQWSIEPQLSWASNYNSNLLLAASGAQATGGTQLSLDSTFKRATETTELDLRPHLDVQRFFSDDSLNAVNSSIQGAFSQHEERTSFSLTGGYERASTLITELSDTGIIDANTRRETSSGALTLGRELSERQHLDLQGGYVNVVYPGGEAAGLVGYHYPNASLSDTYRYSDRVTLGAAIYADQVLAPSTDYDAHDLGLRVTWTLLFSERTKLTAAGAYNETSTNGFIQHGYLWDLHSTRASEKTQWDFDWSRTLQPSGSGFLIRRDSVNLAASHSLTARLDVTLSLQDVHNSNVEGGNFTGISTYLSTDAGLSWHLNQQIILSLTGGIAESQQSQAQTVHGWHTALTTTWTPIPRSISR